MNKFGLGGKAVVLCFVFLCAEVTDQAHRLFASWEGQNSTPCATPEYRQFDFWLGDWDAFDFGTANKVAHVSSRSLAGWVCVA